jgi:hypothetical protein
MQSGPVPLRTIVLSNDAAKKVVADLQRTERRERRASTRSKVEELTKRNQELEKECEQLKREKQDFVQRLNRSNQAVILYLEYKTKYQTLSAQLSVLTNPAKLSSYLRYEPLRKIDSTTEKEWEKLDCGQSKFIPKCNLFIDEANKLLMTIYPNPEEYKRHALASLPERGRCHGAGTYFADLFDDENEKEWWYTEQVRRIMACPNDELVKSVKLFTVFIANIQLGQNPRMYFDRSVEQVNVDKILKRPLIKTISQSFTEAELKKTIEEEVIDGRIVCIMGTAKSTVPYVDKPRDAKRKYDEPAVKDDGYARHTLFVMRRKGTYRLFDANFGTAKAEKFFFPDHLAKKVRECLTDNVGAKLACTEKLAIRMHIVASKIRPRPEKRISDVKIEVEKTELAAAPRMPVVTASTAIPIAPSVTCMQRFFSRMQKLPYLRVLLDSSFDTSHANGNLRL